jgi:hypothetical protein
MIYRAEDKNNDCLDRRRMGQFRRFLEEAPLKEIHLQGRLFSGPMNVPIQCSRELTVPLS